MYTTLLNAVIGRDYLVTDLDYIAVTTECKRMFRRKRLMGVGLHVGSTVKVIRRAFLGGPVWVSIDNGPQVAIGRAVAGGISVCDMTTFK